MNEATLRDSGSGRWVLDGCLSFGTVDRLLRESAGLFAGADTVDIDLSGVERTDSAGLALLVEWMKAALRQGKTLTFRNMPEQMLEIARTCDLVQILPIK